MELDLTIEQAQQLGPLFEDVVRAYDMGLPGILVAQVIRERDSGRAYMRVGFVKTHQAAQLVHQATERLADSASPEQP